MDSSAPGLAGPDDPEGRAHRHRLPGVSASTSREEAASRVSAYVYGNVLVLAALIALRPEDLAGPTALQYVLGTGLSTLVAHVLGQTAGLRVRTGQTVTWEEIRAEGRSALAIATSAVAPTVILGLAWWGAVDHQLALVLAIALTDVRLALLGFTVSRASGERSSRRILLAGLALAFIGALVALLKWQLTH